MQSKDNGKANSFLKQEDIKTGSPQDTFNLYMHHLAQLDKLLSVINLLKKENKQLRHLLQIHQVAISSTLDPNTIKPKITCWNTTLP